MFIVVFPILVRAELSNIDSEFSGFGARYIGMGESGIALLNSNDAIIHNPSLLLNNDTDYLLAVENTAQLDLVNHNFVSFAKRKSPSSAWAGAAVYSGDEALSEITGYFSYTAIRNSSMGKSSLKMLPKGLSLGFNLKYFGKFLGSNKAGSYLDENDQDHQVTGSAHGFGIDLASTYQFRKYHNLAVVIKNSLSAIWWSSENEVGTAEGNYQEGKPVSLKLGYGYQKDRFSFVTDYQPAIASDLDSDLSFGFEYYLFPDKLALRSGYKKELFTGDNEKISFGAGINHKLKRNLYFQLDLAYQVITSWQGHNNLIIACSISGK